MNRAELKATSMGVGVAAIVLLTLGVIFFNTGSKAAAFLALASPLLVAAGIFLFKRGLASMDRLSLPVQLKVRTLEEVLGNLWRAEQSMDRASLLLGIPRSELPTLEGVHQKLAPFVKPPSAPNRPLVPNLRAVDGMHLTLLQEQKRAIDEARRQGQDRIGGAAASHSDRLQRLLRELHRMGLTRSKALDAASSGFSDHVEALEAQSKQLDLAAREAAESIQEALATARGLYKQIGTEEQLCASAASELSGGRPLVALERYLEAGKSLELQLRAEFEREHTAAMRVLVSLEESEGTKLIDPVLQRQIAALSGHAESLASPLQLARLRDLRATIVDVAGKTLADLERRAQTQETTEPGLMARYQQQFGGHLGVGLAEHGGDGFMEAWRARFEFLTIAVRKSATDRGGEKLYQRMKRRIEEVLAEKQSVTAQDLKLKDATDLFERFQQDQPRAVIRQGVLVMSSDETRGIPDSLGKKASTRNKRRPRQHA